MSRRRPTTSGLPVVKPMPVSTLSIVICCWVELTRQPSFLRVTDGILQKTTGEAVRLPSSISAIARFLKKSLRACRYCETWAWTRVIVLPLTYPTSLNRFFTCWQPSGWVWSIHRSSAVSRQKLCQTAFTMPGQSLSSPLTAAIETPRSSGTREPTLIQLSITTSRERQHSPR